MTFLNWLLVGGTLAASIPLIIHLLNRTRFKVLDWGAMHLLESAIKINTRRLQWQALLLLLLRMLIPAVLALCLARPVLTAWRTAAGGSGHSVVLLVDNSLSMQAQAAKAATNSNSTRDSRSATVETLAFNARSAKRERWSKVSARPLNSPCSAQVEASLIKRRDRHLIASACSESSPRFATVQARATGGRHWQPASSNSPKPNRVVVT